MSIPRAYTILLMAKQNPKPQDVLLLPLATVAPQIGLSVAALRMRVHRRQIPFVRVGRSIYFAPEQIERWITQRLSPARPSAFKAGGDGK